MTSGVHDTPFLLAPTQGAAFRKDEAGTSMRSLVYFIATFLIALILGIGSAWYMIEHGSPLTTTKAGPWEGWLSAGNPQADYYTRAHVARSGRLPLTSTVARYFVARNDSNGYALTADCAYLVTGRPLNARWWSVALYDEYGSLIANPSGRYSFNSEEMLRHADGSYRINLARNARPENWLPTGDVDQHLTLMLRIYGPRESDSNGVGLIPSDRLPKIERLSCE